MDKTKGLILQLEQESQKRSLMQTDQSVLSAELAVLKSRERQLQRELETARDAARSLDDELHKVRALLVCESFPSSSLSQERNSLV